MAMKSLFKRLTEKVFSGGRKTMKKKKKAKRSKVKKAKKTVKRAKKRAKRAKRAARRAVRRVAKRAAKKSARKISKISKKSAPKAAAVSVPKAPIKEMKMKKGPHMAFLGLGSNVGDREEYIEQAIFLLSKTPGIKVVKKSTNYETEPEGNTDQPQFLNAAVQIKTILDPYKLLSVLHETENALGRERDVEWGPRTIDLDILLFDDMIISDDKLQVPHPLLHERLFVLKPLAEIAPNTMHPALGRSISEIFEERKNDVGEKYDDDLPGFKDIKKGVPDDYERW